MNLITLDNITKSFSERKLFDKASFFLGENEKVGVIGINGTGKSTLLKIIAGITEVDEGSYIKANNLIIKYLPQTSRYSEDESIIEFVMRQVGVSYDETIETQVKSMLTKLSINDFHIPVGQLSGGQRKILSLVAVLVGKSDILILDEPTNHLDNRMSDWLEEQLKKYKGSIIMVTHDRYFLDSVCNRIAEVDKGKIYLYQENYSGFLKRKTEREDIQIASDRKRKSILRNELAWIMRGARARSTKQKARIERFEEMKAARDFAADARVELSSVYSRLGKTTIELSDICKSYGEKVLINNFSYIFGRDDRVGFLGRNGCGKTTLMKIIAGRVKPDSGQITIGQTVKIGYYTQEIETDKNAGIAYMDPKKRVIDYIRDTAEFVETRDGSISASAMLEKFLFEGSGQYSLIEKLSGGEKRRLNLLRVLMEAPNVLILDEPTNDLDIATLTILEDYLDTFAGIVIIVSHDRYFLDRTVNRIFAFEENGIIKQYEGGYTEYKEKSGLEASDGGENFAKADAKTEKKKLEKSSLKEKPREKKLKFTYSEQKEYETIEAEVAQLENSIKELDKEINEAARDFVRLNQLTIEKKEKEDALEEKMDRWMYLENLKEKIDNQ